MGMTRAAAKRQLIGDSHGKKPPAAQLYQRIGVIGFAFGCADKSENKPAASEPCMQI